MKTNETKNTDAARLKNKDIKSENIDVERQTTTTTKSTVDVAG